MKLAKLNDGPEIFHTLQGEGVGAGRPAVFVRLSLCNLHCVWCDTDHTWNFEGTPWVHEKDEIPGYQKHSKADVIIELSAKEVAEQVRIFDCRRVVITGGEPLLQPEAVYEMINELRSDGQTWFFEIETNGTQLPEDELFGAIDQFNVSPKLANSGIQAKLRQRPEICKSLAAGPNTWFKFVVEKEADIAEIHELMESASISRDRVILMPEGRNVHEIDRIAPWLAEKCRDLGMNFSDRLHVRLWGDERGK